MLAYLLLQLRYFALVLLTLHWAACAWALAAALELGGARAAQEAAAQRGNATTVATVATAAAAAAASSSSSSSSSSAGSSSATTTPTLAWTAVPTDPLSPEVPPQGAWQLYVRSLQFAALAMVLGQDGGAAAANHTERVLALGLMLCGGAVWAVTIGAIWYVFVASSISPTRSLARSPRLLTSRTFYSSTATDFVAATYLLTNPFSLPLPPPLYFLGFIHPSS